MQITPNWENTPESDLSRVSILEITPDGEIRVLGDAPVELGTGTRKRASHVLPCHPVKRVLFVILRLLFGERGRVATFTRSWQGPWQVTLVNHPESFTHQSRRVCLLWERERLRELGL